MGEVEDELKVHSKEEEEESGKNSNEDERYSHKQIYREMVALCKDQHVGEQLIMKITNYLMEALKLTKIDIDETDDAVKTKFMSTLERFQSMIDLIVILNKHESASKREWPRVILTIYEQSNVLSGLQISFAYWLACVESITLGFNNLHKLIDAFERVTFKSGSNSAISCVMTPFAKTKKEKFHLRRVDEAEIEEMFWLGVNKLIRFIASMIAADIFDDSNVKNIRNFDYAFKIVEIIKKIAHKKKPKNRATRKLNFNDVLTKALTASAETRFNRCINVKLVKETESCETQMQILTNGMGFVLIDLREAVHNYTIPHFNLGECLCKAFDKNLKEIIKPIIQESTLRLKQETDIGLLIASIKLYDQIRAFLQLGAEHCKPEEMKLNKCSKWFFPQLTNYVESAERIEKAINVESMAVELSELNATSSAIDSMSIVYAANEFWMQFKIPEEREGEIVEFIASSLCGLAMVYVDKYSLRTQNNSSHFGGIKSLTIVVKNMQYIMNQMQELMLRSGLIMKQLGAVNIFKKALPAITEKIQSTIDRTIREFIPEFREKFTEDADVEGFIEEIKQILDDFEKYFKRNRFETTKEHIWNEVIKILPQISVDEAIKAEKPQNYFSNLKLKWLRLKEIFDSAHDTEEQEDRIKDFEEFLDWYSLDSCQLFKREYQEQTQSASELAKAAAICRFKEHKLSVEILHATNLEHLVSTEDACDTFVEIKLFHSSAAFKTPKLKTKIVYDTYCPLFEECLEFELTEEQKNLKSALVYFILKRKRVLGQPEILGEAFIEFDSIPHEEKGSRKEIAFTKIQTTSERPSMRVLKERGKANDKQTKNLLSELEQRDDEPSTRIRNSAKRIQAMARRYYMEHRRMLESRFGMSTQ